MPAKSKDQQRAAALALQAKQGQKDPDKLQGAAKSMYNSMSKKELREYAETSRKGKPEDKKKKK